MAVQGSGGAEAGRPGPREPGEAGRPGPGEPGEAGRPGPREPGPEAARAVVPAQTLRSWDEAEARLFPLIMSRPEAYKRALILIQETLGQLRNSCDDIPALLAESARGAALLAGDTAAGDTAAGDTAGGERALGDPDERDFLTGIRLDLIAAAACAMRYRELKAALADRGRMEALAGARARGESWAVVEEAGDLARVPYLPYQRVEAHVPSGRAVIVSIEPDETLSRPVWRLDEATLDPATGRLVIGAEIGSYAGAGQFDEALAGVRQRLS
jgi:hypothetical protein